MFENNNYYFDWNYFLWNITMQGYSDFIKEIENYSNHIWLMIEPGTRHCAFKNSELVGAGTII